MIGEYGYVGLTGKDGEGVIMTSLKVLSRYFTEGRDDDHENIKPASPQFIEISDST
jgi:hypothetical protein